MERVKRRKPINYSSLISTSSKPKPKPRLLDKKKPYSPHHTPSTAL
jgi:hypothetical protein